MVPSGGEESDDGFMAHCTEAPKKRMVPKNQRASRKLEVPKILWVMGTQV